MQTSGFFDTYASGPGEDFSVFADVSEEGFYGLGSTLAASPDQFSIPLPDSDPSSLWPQPSSAIYPTSHEARYPANFAAVASNSDAQTPFDFYPPFFNGTTPSVMPTAHQPSASPNVDHSMVLSRSQGHSSSIVNGSSPVHYPFHIPPNHLSSPNSTLTHVQSHYNDARIFVEETQRFDSAMNAPYRHIQPALAGATQIFPSIPPGSSMQAMVPRSPTAKLPTRQNSRGSRSMTSSPYRPTRAFSSPIQSVSPTETVAHTCEWIKNDGIICGALITRATLSDHLTTHGVEKLKRDHHLSCRWFGCRPRGGKDTMNRESIARHIREKHLGYRRASN